jgi:membrane protease YdiL (CAAX protease family)
VLQRPNEGALVLDAQMKMKQYPLAKATLFVTLSAVTVVGYLFVLSVLRGKLGAFSNTVPAMLVATATLVLNWRFLKSEGRSLVDLGFDRPVFRIGQTAAGFLAGSLLVGSWALVLRFVASASWHAAPPVVPRAALGAVLFVIFNNAGEELVYRGYLFLLLARAYSRIAAVGVTCILFTLLHVQAGVPLAAAIAGVLTSSLVFAALFVRWQSVPLVLGFHAATNILQELLGLRPSALTAFVPALGGNAGKSPSYAVLALTGLINVGLALAIFVSARTRARKTQ